MNCTKCNAEIVPGTNFCEKCGAPVLLQEPEQSTPAFCSDCGSALRPQSIFCPGCGSPVKYRNMQSIPPVATEHIHTPQPYAPPTVQTWNPPSISPKSPVNNTNKILFIIVSVLLIAQIVLRFITFGGYTVTVDELDINLDDTLTLNEIMGDDTEPIIFAALSILAAGLSALPFLKPSYQKRRFLLLPLLLNIWNSIVILLAVMMLSDYVSTNESRIEASLGSGSFECSWSLAIGGWLNILCAASIIVIAFTILFTSKKKQPSDYR